MIKQTHGIKIGPESASVI